MSEIASESIVIFNTGNLSKYKTTPVACVWAWDVFEAIRGIWAGEVEPKIAKT